MDPFLCPKCHAPGAFESTCDRCDRPLVPRAELPPWGLAGRVETRPALTARGLVPLLIPLSILLLLQLLHYLSITRRPSSAYSGPEDLVILYLLGLFTALTFLRRYLAMRRNNPRGELLRAAVAAPDATAVLAGTRDGEHVRIEGTVRSLQATYTPEGERCVAWQPTERVSALEADGAQEGPVLRVRAKPFSRMSFNLLDGTEQRTSVGGVFSVETASGEQVLVLARHLALETDGVLRDGDRVSIVGCLRHIQGSEEGTGHYRIAPERFELTGTEALPLLARRLNERARVGVRVATKTVDTVASVQERADAVVPPASAAAPPRAARR